MDSMNSWICHTYYQGIQYYEHISTLYPDLKIKWLSNISSDFYFNLQKQFNTIQTLRSRELRNILLQDYHIHREIINKIIDRNELKELLSYIILEKQQHVCGRISIYLITILCGIVTVLYLFYQNQKVLYKGMKFFLSFFLDKYCLKQKLKLLNMCSTVKGATLGMIYMMISLIFEVLVVWIQTSIMLGWIIPSSWVGIRSCLFTGFISLPVGSTLGQLSQFSSNPSHIRPTSGVSQNRWSSSSFGGWDLDIGSMISVAILKGLIQYLDNQAAAIYVKAQEIEDDFDNLPRR